MNSLFVREDIGEKLISKLNFQVQQGLELEHAWKLSDETLVHEFRKAVKRSRSLLRILKSRIPAASYYRIDDLLGDSARMMTFPRESSVNLNTFMELCLDENNYLSPDFINQIRTQLASIVLEAYSNKDNRFISMKNSSFKMLFNAQFYINGLTCNQFKLSDLNTLLEKTYRKGKKLFEASYYSTDTEVIHKWRRYAKHLLFQLKFAPHDFNFTETTYLTKLDKITNALGTDHDLAVLEEYLVEHVSTDPENMKQLKLAIMRVRSLMQKKAFKLGNELYSKNSLQAYFSLNAIKTLI